MNKFSQMDTLSMAISRGGRLADHLGKLNTPYQIKQYRSGAAIDDSETCITSEVNHIILTGNRYHKNKVKFQNFNLSQIGRYFESESHKWLEHLNMMIG